MNLFKNLESGKHGNEGLSNGGEIWNSNYSKQEAELHAYYLKIGGTIDKLHFISNEFYKNIDSIPSPELVKYVVNYNISLAEYRKLNRDLFMLYLDTEWDENNDKIYLELYQVSCDMKNKLQAKHENSGDAR